MKVPIFLNGIARLQKIVTTIFNAVFLRRISSVKKREKNRILACQNDFVETIFFILILLAPLITRHSNWNTYRLLWWVQLLQNSFKNFPRRKAQVDLKTRNCTSITISKFRILSQYVCNGLKKKKSNHWVDITAHFRTADNGLLQKQTRRDSLMNRPSCSPD